MGQETPVFRGRQGRQKPVLRWKVPGAQLLLLVEPNHVSDVVSKLRANVTARAKAKPLSSPRRRGPCGAGGHRVPACAEDRLATVADADLL